MLATILHSLGEPWSNPFMRRALLEVALIGIVGGALGCWVILHEISYGAESLAHALFPGLVIAALVGLPLLLGGAIGVAAAAIAVAVFGRTPEIGRDTAIAVVITSLFGLGVVLALSPSTPAGLDQLLFGDLFGVTHADLIYSGALALAVLIAMLIFHRLFLTVGFDRQSAAAFGAPPVVADLALLGLVAAAIVVGVQGLGNLLVVAVLIAPAATARLLARRMVPMMVLAASLAVAEGAAGLYVSY
jgi:ABC-type Mn2+/Zn2+ transport system permease subunit